MPHQNYILHLSAECYRCHSPGIVLKNACPSQLYVQESAFQETSALVCTLEVLNPGMNTDRLRQKLSNALLRGEPPILGLLLCYSPFSSHRLITIFVAATCECSSIARHQRCLKPCRPAVHCKDACLHSLYSSMLLLSLNQRKVIRPRLFLVT